jgi:hypothetical protein
MPCNNAWQAGRAKPAGPSSGLINLEGVSALLDLSTAVLMNDEDSSHTVNGEKSVAVFTLFSLPNTLSVH